MAVCLLHPEIYCTFAHCQAKSRCAETGEKIGTVLYIKALNKKPTISDNETVNKKLDAKPKANPRRPRNAEIKPKSSEKGLAMWTKREKVYHRDGYKCLKCGEEDIAKLTLDHVVPKAKGGSNEVGNLQTLCVRCNGEKGSKHSKDYRKPENRPTPDTTGLDRYNGRWGKANPKPDLFKSKAVAQPFRERHVIDTKSHQQAKQRINDKYMFE